MMDLIRESIITITGVGTIVGLYIKATNNFIIEIIRMKYNIAPGKESMFSIIIKLIIGILLVIYSFFLVTTVIILFNNGIADTISNSIANIPKYDGNIISLIILISFFGSIICSYLSIYYTISFFIKKLETGNIDRKNRLLCYINFLGRIFSIIIVGIAMVTIYYTIVGGIDIVRTNGLYIFENNISNSNMENFLSCLMICFICITSFILINSSKQIFKELRQYDSYILLTNNGNVFCRCYLEYNDYILVLLEGNDLFIKKSEVKEINKILYK